MPEARGGAGAGRRSAVRTLAGRRRTLAAGGALPFGFAWHFPDAAAESGFDLLLGNPPWVRPHAVTPDVRLRLRTHYACARPPAGGGAPAGFGPQVDLAALFTERALALTRPGGVTALLLPAKLWRTLAGGGIRTLVLRESRLLGLDDWSDAPSTFDAAVYPSLLVARRTPPAAPPLPAPGSTRVRVHHAHGATEAALPASALSLDPDDPASPWLLLPPLVRRAFDTLRAAGPPLGRTTLPHPTLGVKCGVNDAFLVELVGVDGELARVRQADRIGTVERALLRPALRGEHLAGTPAQALAPPTEFLLWPYDPTGRPLDTLPVHAARWLAPWRFRLARRSDARHTRRGAWWTLFRTDGADSRRPRVVWPDLARIPHPRLLPAGDPSVPLNTCYVAAFEHPDDASAFAALLAAPPIAAWLATLAEPARGGYRRFLAWTVARLPIPADWPAARDLLAPLGPGAPAEALTDAALSAYGVDRSAVEPLLAWVPAARLRHPPPIAPSAAPPSVAGRVREPAWATRPRRSAP
jgi:hypothetical protein